MVINLTRIDQTSFWIGFIAASIIWLLIIFARPAIDQIIQKIKENQKSFKARSVSRVEELYIAQIQLQAQRLHLGSSLFSLDAIAIEPKFMAPPARITPDDPILYDDFITEIVPYLPAWPELASTFKAPSLTIFEALSGNSDIVITGQPGTGKTFTLAYIALQLIKNIKRGDDQGTSKNNIPFLIHHADLDLNIINEESPLNQIIEFLSNNYHLSDVHRMSKFVLDVFDNGRALLLIDGTDELAPDRLSPIINYLKLLKQKYPQVQVITTGIPENLNGLATLNFVPLTLANWETSEYLEFLSKWGQLWTELNIFKDIPQGSTVDPIMLNFWINSIQNSLTPLELTFLTWGCYAGDIESGDVLDAIKAHIYRLKPIEAPLEALEMLALQVFTSTEFIFEPRKARSWIKAFEPSEQNPDFSENEDELNPLSISKENSRNRLKISKSKAPSLGLISKFSETGLLITHRNNQMRFIHPIIGGYLAGKILGNLTTDQILSLPNWSGKYLAMKYFAALGNADELAQKIIEIPDHPLERNILTVARWLRNSRQESKWRTHIMETLATMLRVPNLPLGFRGQVLAAILQGGDPGAPILFHQMLNSDDPELLQLSMLGCAALKYTKVIKEIVQLTNHYSPNVQRTASLALVSIGTQQAIDHVASVLLHGDEEARFTAAKALAYHSEVGHSMLREGATMEDILVRRAITYGLGAVDEPWATDILLKLQIQDDQWIVRNAATEVLDNKLKINKFIPTRLPPPSECAWLIAFAGKKGVGISPDSPATDILLLALTEGSEAEQLASLDYLRGYPSSNVFAIFYKFLYGSNLVLREAIFRTIWVMGSRGVKIPDPQLFGEFN